MDPRDRPHLLPNGAACTACGVVVPTGTVQDPRQTRDVAFVELGPACRGDLVSWLGR